MISLALFSFDDDDARGVDNILEDDTELDTDTDTDEDEDEDKGKGKDDDADEGEHNDDVNKDAIGIDVCSDGDEEHGVVISNL